MPIATWTHGGSPLNTDIGTPPAGVAANGDLAASAATWNGTGNENGDTGTVAVTSEVSPGNIATVSVGVQLFDDGSFTGTDPLNTLQIIFDWALTNGPMGTATAESAFNSTMDATDDSHGPGSSTGTYDRTDTGTNLGIATIADMFAAVGIGGFAAITVNCPFTYSAGTFSNHNRRLAISNLQIVANYGTSTVTDISPDSGPVLGGQVVTITGTGLTGVTEVNFINGLSSSPATSVTVAADGLSLTCVTPPALFAAGSIIFGPYDVEVVGAGTLSGAYTYVGVVKVTPASGSIIGGQAVTITGSGFNAATNVKFGGNAVTAFAIVSNTQITTTTPFHRSGAVDVEVVGVATGTGLYTYSTNRGFPTNVPADAFRILPVPVASPAVQGGASGGTTTNSGGGSPSELSRQKFDMEIKRRIESIPFMEWGVEQVVGTFTPDQIPQLPVTKIDFANSPRLLGRATSGAGEGEEIDVLAPLVLDASGLGLFGGPFTAGSVIFADSLGRFAQDNSNLFWDDTNNFFGIGTAATPLARLHVPVESSTAIAALIGIGNSAPLFAFGFADTTTYHRMRSAGAGNDNILFELKNPATHWLGIQGDLKALQGMNVGFGTGTAVPTLGLGVSGSVGIGSASPTARLFLPAGTTAASSAPMKFTSGSLLTAPEIGAHEFLTDDLFITITTGTARKGLILDDGARLTSGQIPIATTNGRLIDNGAPAALTKTDDTNVTLTLTGSPTIALLKTANIAAGWTGALSVARGGTGTGTAFTAGSVIFAGASGVYSQDNSNLFFDDSNNRLGVGTASPATRLQVGATTDAVTNAVRIVTQGSTTTVGPVVSFFRAGTTEGALGYGVDVGNNKFIFAADPASLSIANLITAAQVVIDASNKRIGLGVTAPTASVHAKAGGTAASSAPLKFTSGSLMTTAEAGAFEFLTDDFYATITTGAARKGIVLNDGTALTATRVPFATTNGRLTDDSDMTFATDTLTVTKLSAPTSVSTGTLAQTGKTTTYNNVATAGWGEPAIYGSGRSTAQTAAVASVAAYTNAATDGSFEVLANVLVTTSTTHNFTVAVDYTDEGNTARTLTLSFTLVAGGALVTSVDNANGAVPYMGVPQRIRSKASTAITIKTVGTFTSVSYNVEGSIIQVA